MNPSNLPPDPYKTLNVEKSASSQEIKTAYRKLVLKCHPDKVLDPKLKAEKQDEFQRVQQAYELLANDSEKQKYDDLVTLLELRKRTAASQSKANTSAQRSAPPRYTSFEVRTAEPAPGFRTAPSPTTSKVYTQYQSSRSYEDELHRSSTTRYEEEDSRRARRAASYEKDRPSRRDEERRERKRREEARRDEEEEIKREIRKRAARKATDKDKDKERRRDAEEKRSRHKSPYVEPYEAPPEEVYLSSRSEKKSKSSSSSRKLEEREREREKPSRRDPSPRVTKLEESASSKMDGLMATAASYMEKRRNPGISRAQTFHEGSGKSYVPPPPVPEVLEPEDEDFVQRPAARPSGRRASHDTPRPRDKVSPSPYKTGEPVVVDAVPPVSTSSPRVPPTLRKSQTTPPTVPESPPRPARSNTESFVRSTAATAGAPPPNLPRAQTWMAGVAEDRDRARRPTAAAYASEDSEDERPRHRSRRDESSSYKYQVRGGKTHKVDDYSYEDEPRSSRKKSGPYYDVPQADYSHPRVRPEMIARESSYAPPTGWKVKRSAPIENVSYSGVPHTSREYAAYA